MTIDNNVRSAVSDAAATIHTRAETTAIFERLRQLKKDCGVGCSKHDQAMILISACIVEGLDSGLRITGALAKLGMTRRHIGLILKEGEGADPQRHSWQKQETGRYTLH